MTRPAPTEIARRIAKRDPAFRAVVQRIGPPPWTRATPVAQRYATLSRAIVFQLISTAAGRTIFGRLNELVGPDFTPEMVLSTSVEDLRRVGLSGGKVTALRDLATQVINGTVRLERHGRMTDSEVERELIGVKGIGPWTAHMYLMFNLARPDVWPVGDLGVRNGWSVLHGLPDMISSKELETHGETFRGYRSAVAWYCWRALD